MIEKTVFDRNSLDGLFADLNLTGWSCVTVSLNSFSLVSQGSSGAQFVMECSYVATPTDPASTDQRGEVAGIVDMGALSDFTADMFPDTSLSESLEIMALALGLEIEDLGPYVTPIGQQVAGLDQSLTAVALLCYAKLLQKLYFILQQPAGVSPAMAKLQQKWLN